MTPTGIPHQKALRHHTLPFLACLLGCSVQEVWNRSLTYQTFDDEKPGGMSRPSLARVLHGRFGFLLQELERLNRAGAGIFVSVNGTDGRGRRKANISLQRAWWADLDTKDALNAFDPSCGPLEASMLVKTPGGWHQYFLATCPRRFRGDADRSAFEDDQLRVHAAMAPFGADPKVNDVGRVLRVPGFLHRKGVPRLVELVKADGPRYTLRQIRAAFPPLGIQGKPGVAPRVALPAQGRPENWRERVAAFLLACEPSIQGNNGSRALFTTCMKLYTRFDLTIDEVVEQIVTHYNVDGRCVPLWSLEEIHHKATGAHLATGPARGGAWLEGRAHV